MASTASVGSTSSGSTTSATTDRTQSLSVADFTKMLIAELQNQDPSQPMSNTELLQQVSQIRAISSNDQLTSTLQSVLLGQNLASAGNLIGRSVKGLDAQGNRVSGTVGSVSITSDSATLNIGTSQIDLKNVTDISAATPGG